MVKSLDRQKKGTLYINQSNQNPRGSSRIVFFIPYSPKRRILSQFEISTRIYLNLKNPFFSERKKSGNFFQSTESRLISSNAERVERIVETIIFTNGKDRSEIWKISSVSKSSVATYTAADGIFRKELRKASYLKLSDGMARSVHSTFPRFNIC